MRTTTSKITLVTGAGAGIGEAIARALAERGDTVICTDVDESSVRAVAGSLANASAFTLDVRDAGATQQIVDEIVATHGRLDVAVANAGYFIRKPALETSREEFESLLQVNLRGAFLTAQAAGRAMIAGGDGGSILFTGSIHSVRPMRQQVAYAASKGGVRMMSTVLAREWARHQIRVNTLGPGFTETAATAPTRSDPVRLDAMMKRVPLKRIGRPSEIAAAAAFLTSDEASFVTGAYLNVDGGWLTS